MPAVLTATHHIAGDFVVFTDDAVLQRPEWLLQMRVSTDFQPSFSIFGDSIFLHGEIPPEDWILKVEGSLWAIKDPAWE
jgi:hypothetical protein